MDIALVTKAITTDDLLKWANQYCEGYKVQGEEVHRDVYFRVADFLKHVESQLLRQANVGVEEYKKSKLTPRATAPEAGAKE